MNNKTYEEKIKSFKENTSIIEVARKHGLKVNSHGRCSCPWHGEDKHPSMTIYEKTNTFKCYACERQGDVIDFIQLLDGKTIHDIIGIDRNNKNNKTLEEFIKNNIKYTKDEGYKFDRVHFYLDEKGIKISAKIIYKDYLGEKAAIQVKIEDGYRVGKAEVNHKYIFNYPEVLRAVRTGKEIFIVEGEKDAETLMKHGYTATTSRYGGRCIKDEELACLRDANIILIGDKDKTGESYVKELTSILFPIAKTIKTIILPGLHKKGDITDWFSRGYTKDELNQLVKESIDKKIEKEIEEFDFTDLGIISKFRDYYKDDVKYCCDTKEFVCWESNRWIIYNDDSIIREKAIEFIQIIVKKIEQYISYINDKDKVKALKKNINKLKKHTTLNFLSKMYTGNKEIDTLRIEFDEEIRFLNCKNGIIDTFTGEILQKSRDIKITKYIDVYYCKGKKNNLFKSSIDRLMGYDKQEVEAFEVLLGYLLSGHANQKIIPIITGDRDTGKTQLFEIIKEVMGNGYVKAVNKSLLTSEWEKANGASPDIVNLIGARLALCTETSDVDYLNGDLVKKLVGRDTITARALYKGTVNFTPQFVPIIFTNYKPRFNGADDAIIRRILPIDVLNPLKEDEVNPFYKEDVLKDREGLFSYLVDCIVKFNQIGKIIIPERWQKIKESYTNENNPIKSFKEKYLIIENGSNIDSDYIYQTFLNWYRDNCGDEKITKAKLTRELGKLGVESFPSNGKTKYKNITLIR